MSVRPLPFALMAALAACSPIGKAERLEKDGKLEDAALAYWTAASAEPGAAWAAEALWRAGTLWASKNVCERAVAAFEDLARVHGGAWRDQAADALLDCPDYMPTGGGWAWTIGDSETMGSNMKQVTTSTPTAEGAVYEARIYAGAKLFTTLRKEVRKGGWRVEELDPKTGERTVVLRYPFRAGTAWSSKRGDRTVSFRIEAGDEEIVVKAGTFKGCLKVREQLEGLSSWTNVYYAPGVGRVLTTVAGPGFEHRNAELLTYERP